MVAPAIVGTARKNENSAAFLRVSLFAIPPTMVDIERLIPGITERHWNKPNEKRTLRRYFVLFSALIEDVIAEKHKDTTQHKRYGYHPNRVQQPIEQTAFLGCQAYNNSWKHTNDKQSVQFPHFRLEGKELLPIQTNNRKNSSKLYDERKSVNKRIALLHAQQVLGYYHMPVEDTGRNSVKPQQWQ